MTFPFFSTRDLLESFYSTSRRRSGLSFSNSCFSFRFYFFFKGCFFFPLRLLFRPPLPLPPSLPQPKQLRAVRWSGRERRWLRARRWDPPAPPGAALPLSTISPYFVPHARFPGNLLSLLFPAHTLFFTFLPFFVLRPAPGRSYPCLPSAPTRPRLLSRRRSRTCRPDRLRYLPGRGKLRSQLPGAPGSRSPPHRSLPPSLVAFYSSFSPRTHPPVISLSILSPPRTGPPSSGAACPQPSPAPVPGQLRPPPLRTLARPGSARPGLARCRRRPAEPAWVFSAL